MRLTPLLLLISACAVNPKLEGYHSYPSRKTCAFLIEAPCADLSAWFWWPGMATVLLLPGALAYIVSKTDKPESENTGLYHALIHPFATVFAIIGLLCAGLSVAYDGPIDWYGGEWFWAGVAGFVLAIVTIIKSSDPHPAD